MRTSCYTALFAVLLTACVDNPEQFLPSKSYTLWIHGKDDDLTTPGDNVRRTGRLLPSRSLDPSQTGGTRGLTA